MAYEILEMDEQQPYTTQYEGVPGWIGRQIGRTASRVGETIAGLPRATNEVAGMLSNATPFGSLAAPFINKGVELGRQLLPSSEDVRETIGQTTQPGYLEPQTPGEEIGDAITQATTSLLLGKVGIPKMPASAKDALQSVIGALKTTGKATTAASAGQLGKFLSKELGAGEFGQEATNIGMTLLASAGLDTGIKQKANEIYKIRDASIREGDLMFDKSLSEKLRNIRKQFLNVGPEDFEGKKEVRDAINSIDKEAIGMSHYRLENLPTIKSMIGESKYRVANKSSRQVIGDLYNELTTALKDPSKTGNKVFSEAQAAGDQLWQHVKGAEKINDWAKYIISSKPFLGTGAVGTLFSAVTNPVATLGRLGGAAAITGGVYGAAKGGHFMYSIASNPSVRKEYMRMMKAAAKQNTGQFVKSAERINKLMEPKYEVLELD